MSEYFSSAFNNTDRNKLMFLLQKLLFFVVIAVISPLASFAQTIDTASIRGKVLDQNKAAVVGASIVVTNESTGLSRNVVTDENGIYTISNLPLTGKYKITFSENGFSNEEKSNISTSRQ